MVTHYGKPHIGGIETVSLEEARRLAQDGHAVTIVTSRAPGQAAEENIEGVRIRRVKAFNFLERRLGVPYPLFSPDLIQVLAEELDHADVCIVHGFVFQSSLAAAWMCRRAKVPYVIYQSNTFINYTNPVLNLVQRLNDQLFGKSTLSHAAYSFAISAETRNYMKSLTTRDVHVLYSAVDHLRFAPHGSRRELRGALGLPVDKFIVLTVRRLVFKNSVDTFVATANLLKDDPRVYFVIVGDGPDRRRIEKYIQANHLGNCLLTGFVPDAALPDYYGAANLFVLPSRTGEGLGMVLLEAMASGVPVVATRGGGQVELVQEGRNGFLVDPCAPDQIADVVRAHINATGALETIRCQNLELVRRQFLWDDHMTTLMASLKAVARNGNGR